MPLTCYVVLGILPATVLGQVPAPDDDDWDRKIYQFEEKTSRYVDRKMGVGWNVWKTYLRTKTQKVFKLPFFEKKYAKAFCWLDACVYLSNSPSECSVKLQKIMLYAKQFRFPLPDGLERHSKFLFTVLPIIGTSVPLQKKYALTSILLPPCSWGVGVSMSPLVLRPYFYWMCSHQSVLIVTEVEMYMCHLEVLTELSLSVNISKLGAWIVSKVMVTVAWVFLHSSYGIEAGRNLLDIPVKSH